MWRRRTLWLVLATLVVIATVWVYPRLAVFHHATYNTEVGTPMFVGYDFTYRSVLPVSLVAIEPEIEPAGHVVVISPFRIVEPPTRMVRLVKDLPRVRVAPA